MDEKTLLSLKKEIESAKQELSELKGRERYLFQQLKKEFNCDSVEDAITKHKALSDTIEKLDNKIAKGIQELQKKYDLV